MMSKEELTKAFEIHSGIMKTRELNAIGLSSRQIQKLMNMNMLSKIRTGAYELVEHPAVDETIIARLFPYAVICLESALLHYGYTDRIPSEWQIAVDKDTAKSLFRITYPVIKPFYIEKKYLEIGLDSYELNGVNVRIYDRERTICDVLRYSNKIEKEVFNNAIQRYIKDNKKNVKKLMEYAKELRVMNKVKIFIGVWI